MTAHSVNDAREEALRRERDEARAQVKAWQDEELERRRERDEARAEVDRLRGEVRYAYAIATLDDGSKVRRVVPRWEIEKARALGARNGPWTSHYDEMAKKTAIRRLYKMLPKSAEMAAASQIEDADERGIPTARAVTAEVRELAEEVAIALPAPAYDATTGEVLEESAQAERKAE